MVYAICASFYLLNQLSGLDDSPEACILFFCGFGEYLILYHVA